MLLNQLEVQACAHLERLARVVIRPPHLFGGRGKISSIMGDFARGITEFRKGLKDDEDDKSDEESSGQLGNDAEGVSPRTSDSEKTSG